tara:strand:- start:2858 stop:3901 length:1044 start_codon:yes stop_codon:yes gene_type:complete
MLSSEQRRALTRAHPPRRWIYWLDLLLSGSLAWALFAYSCTLPLGSPAYLLTTAADTLIFLRVGYFMHELSHRSERELPGFSLAWNLLIGIPILLPSMMMLAHRDHHRAYSYGTERDPEYAPIASWTRLRMLQSVVGFGLVPLLLPLRFGLLAPLSLLHPKLRAHLVRKFSTVDINAGYDRPAPRGAERKIWRWQEIACFLFIWAALTATWLGWLALFVHLQRLIVMSASLMLNQWRTLVIHRYRSDGAPMSGLDQVHDATTFAGHALVGGLISPLGSRFHALHHELPHLPYHALGQVHRQLLDDETYRQTFSRGVLGAWLEAWKHRSGSGQHGQPGPGAPSEPAVA